MIPPSAALPASVALASLAPLLGPLSVLATAAALVALVVIVAAIALERREKNAWRRIPRPAPGMRAHDKPLSRSAA